MQKAILSFMRFFFYHFYHRLSWTYDIVAYIVSLGQWNEWVCSIVPKLYGENILEIGFGPGHLQAELHRQKKKVFGLDESRQMARRAFHRLQQIAAPSNLARGFAQALPFGESFDTVVATFPSEYISSPSTLQEVFRVLKPGGIFVVLIMAWHGDQTLPERLATLLFRITGHAAPGREALQEKIFNFFQNSTFEVSLETSKIKNSTLMFIVARKPERL